MLLKSSYVSAYKKKSATTLIKNVPFFFFFSSPGLSNGDKKKVLIKIY